MCLSLQITSACDCVGHLSIGFYRQTNDEWWFTMVESTKGSPTKKKSKKTQPAEIHRTKKMRPSSTSYRTKKRPGNFNYRFPATNSPHNPPNCLSRSLGGCTGTKSPGAIWTLTSRRLVEPLTTESHRGDSIWIFFDEQRHIITWEIFLKNLGKPGITNKQIPVYLSFFRVDFLM